MLKIKDLPKDMSVIGFKLFYTDGTVFIGTGNPIELMNLWKNAPNDQIQVLLVYHKGQFKPRAHYRHIFHGCDYYSFDGNIFNAENDSRLLTGEIKNGKWTTKENFKKIRDLSLEDYLI